MNLGRIYVAREAWQRLCALRMPPQMAYRLLKYQKLVAVEDEVLERQRVKLIREISGAKEGESATIAAGTLEYDQFLAKFNALALTVSDLKPSEMKLDEVLAALGSEQGNVLSVADLGALEPFFGSE